MRFSFSLSGVIVLATLALAAPRTNFRDVINDLNALREKAGSLESHVHNLDLGSMIQDRKAILDGLDRIAVDARAAKGFTSSEAGEVLDAARSLGQEMIQLSNEVIANKNHIPIFVHSAVAADLQTITTHTKGAGEAVVGDCPVDRKHEAIRVYGDIATALNNAVKAFSS